MLSWLDSLLFGIRRIYWTVLAITTALPDRPALEFVGDGVTAVEDDTVNKRTRITIGAGAGAVPNTRAITVDPASGLTVTPSDGVLDEDLELGYAGLQNDTQHGNRGGGDLHDNATGAVAGFMSAADKAKLDLYPPAADMATKVYVDDAIALAGGGVLSVTSVSGSPVTTDNTDPVNPVLDWGPSADVSMATHGIIDCPSLANSAGDITCTPGASNQLVVRRDALTTTNVACISARNATAATSGVTVQDGGAVLSEGTGWATTAGGSSKTVRGGFLTVPVTGSSAAIRVYRVYDAGSGTLTRGSYFTDFDPALFGIADVMSTVILDAASNGVRSAINGNGGLKFPGTDTMLTSGGSNDVVLATNSTDRHRITSTGATTRSFDASAPERKQWGTAGVNYVDDVGFATGTLAQSTTTTIYTITLANNSYVKVEIDCVAYDTGTPDRVEMFGRRGAAIRIAGTTTLLSSGSDKHALIENGVWGSPVSVAFSVSGTSFKVDVTTPALDIKVVVQRIAIFVGTTSA